MIIILNNKLKKNEKWVNDDFQKQNKKRQRNIKFKKGLKHAQNIGKIFVKSVAKQAIQPETLILGGAIGLGQGFKYNGNWKRGVVAGAITLGVMGTICGVANVAKYVEGINAAKKH